MNKTNFSGLTAILFLAAIIFAPTISQARFISVDPKAAKYPSISPYTYVLNNPIRKIDPTGEEQYDVITDVYIPFPMVANFLGDNRGPSLNPNRSSRIQHTATIETDPNISRNPLISSDVSIGATHAIVPFAPYVVSGQASADKMSTAASRTQANAGDNASLTVSGSAANPLVPGAPAIDYTFQVSVVPGQPPQISGSHNAFPAYTVTVIDKSGKIVGTYQYSPKSESEAFKLIDLLYPNVEADGKD